jgi:hypothetical protein
MVSTSTTESVRERSLCSGSINLDSGIDYFLDDTDAATPNNLDWKIIGDCICNNKYSIRIEGNIIMNREEFFEWLGTCPSHKWEVIQDDAGCVWVSFRNIEEYDDDQEVE